MVSRSSNCSSSLPLLEFWLRCYCQRCKLHERPLGELSARTTSSKSRWRHTTSTTRTTACRQAQLARCRRDNDPTRVSQNIGVLVFLLPYLEQPMLYDGIKNDINLRLDHHPSMVGATPTIISPDLAPKTDVYWRRSITWSLAQTRVPGFLCPSDNAESAVRVSATFATHHRPPSNGTSVQMWTFTGAPLGRTNYLGSAGRLGEGGNSYWRQWRGPFWTRSKNRFAVWQKNSADLFRQHFTRSIESRNAEN